MVQWNTEMKSFRRIQIMNTSTTHAPRKESEGSYSLRLCKKICLGREREYALFCDAADGTSFRISIRERGEESAGELTCSFADAAALYDRIVLGEVAPYVLGEILEDFLQGIE